MKEIIYILMLMIVPIIVFATFADFIEPDNCSRAELEVDIRTTDPLDANFYEYSEENITNNIYCMSENCETNIGGGTVNVDENITNLNLNQYFTTNDYSTGYGSGMSLRELIDKLARVAQRFMDGEKDRHVGDEWNLWALLDAVFVSHMEYQPTYNNVMFLADEVDRLKAENKLLKQAIGISLDEGEVECQTMINKAKRTGVRVENDNGYFVDIPMFGETCVKLFGVQ